MKHTHKRLAILAALALAALACATPWCTEEAATGPDEAAQTEMQSESGASEAEEPYPQKDGTSLGDPAAPVEIVEFFDFQCPHCFNSYSEIEKDLIAQYVSTGQVYLTYKPVGFLGPDSVLAAQGAYCAADQNFFWEFHDLVFANYSGGNSGAYSAENLTRLAGEIPGMDVDEFASCMADDENLAPIQAAHDQAQSFGVSGVPGFVINGQVTLGEQSMDQMSRAIEAAMGN